MTAGAYARGILMAGCPNASAISAGGVLGLLNVPDVRGRVESAVY